MDFDRQWTIFAVDAEHEAYGMSRIVKAHNDLRRRNMLLRKALENPCNFGPPCGNCEACEKVVAVFALDTPQPGG